MIKQSYKTQQQINSFFRRINKQKKNPILNKFSISKKYIVNYYFDSFPKFNLSHINNQVMILTQTKNHKNINNSHSVPLKDTRRNTMMKSFSSISKITLPQPFQPQAIPLQFPPQASPCKMNVKQLFEQVRRHFRLFNQKRLSVKQTKQTKRYQKQRDNNRKDDIRVFLNCKSALKKNSDKDEVNFPPIAQIKPTRKIIMKDMLQIIKASKPNALKSNPISVCYKNPIFSVSKKQRLPSNNSFKGIGGSPLARSASKQLLKKQNAQRRIKTQMNQEQLLQNYKYIKVSDHQKRFLNPSTIDLSFELPIRISLQKSSLSSSQPQ